MTRARLKEKTDDNVIVIITDVDIVIIIHRRDSGLSEGGKQMTIIA